jgi:hypothetical protein
VQSGFDKSSQRRNREAWTVGYCEHAHIRGTCEDPIVLGTHGIEDGIIEAWTLFNVEMVSIPDAEKRSHILVDFRQYKHPSNAAVS